METIEHVIKYRPLDHHELLFPFFPKHLGCFDLFLTLIYYQINLFLFPSAQASTVLKVVQYAIVFIFKYSRD